NKYVAWSMRAFIASTSSLLVTTVGGAILLFASGLLTPNSTAEVVGKVDGLFGLLSIFFILGLALFMAGIAVAGWIHSKSVGIFAITMTVLSCLIMAGVYIFLAQIFTPS
ncbi:MAG: hypothetical protein KJZ52_07565, partial [Anaerolineales bacterium]|nr:hypothetical protein [Anaerolineales bacterium]